MPLADEKARIAQQMENLREMLEDGEISPLEFKRQNGPLARRLLGDREYEHLRKRKRQERRRAGRPLDDQGLGA